MIMRRQEPPTYPRGVSVCLPTYKRAEHLPRRLAALLDSIPDCQVELIVVEDEDDRETFKLPLGEILRRDHVKVRRLLMPAGTCPSKKWNAAARVATQEWLFMACDDVEWVQDWWPGYEQLPESGYLGLHDDKSRGGGIHTMWLARRDWLTKHAGGTLACPLLRHSHCDTLMTVLAIKANCNFVARKLVGEHVHKFDKKRRDIATDEARKRAHRWRDDGQDQQVYEGLKERGFPVGPAASPEWRPLW